MTVETVRIDRLRPADSPRLDGEDPDHIRLLAESDAALPPILVHRGSMRVIDGMHRLRVAQSRGDSEVPVKYFDGTELEAFIRAVQLNVTHGLPLSLSDRESAATRILASGGSWSDRAIARMTGLSAPTVARIRARSRPDHRPEDQARIGRDGRVRPLNSSAGRLRAGEIISAEPHLSLREIAKRAGISVGTARDVRNRLGRGEGPLPARFLPGSRPTTGAAAGPLDRTAAPATGPDPMDGSYVSDLTSLQKDPSLRLTGSGRFLLRWLSFHAISQEKRANLIRSLPAHNKARIAYMAKCCSRWWAEFADDVEQQQECRDIPRTG
ncbi:ParB/RepB/Spo0J family partition protein [Kitasatospora sp. NPDC059577]|uniref:ParB/RepB/Spo0J family partition protein n=1 Tax=unclassified Kitasatospora TaxID=2633591 RepID=UPI0036739647